MATSEVQESGGICEDERIVRQRTFDELTADEQIQKLRYELQCAARAISRIGNKTAMLCKHEHSSSGEVVVNVADQGRRDTCDRSEFLK